MAEEESGTGRSPRPAPGTAHDEEAVRRLLSAAGAAPEPLPPEVADRLESTLRQLTPQDPHAASPRGPRRWPALVVAAALLSAVAVGVGALLTGQQAGQHASSSSSAGGQAAGRPAGESGGEQARTGGQGLVPGGVATPEAPAGPLPVVHLSSFAADAQRIADRVLAGTGRTQPPQKDTGASSGHDVAPARECDLPRLGVNDRLVAVRLDGSPASLVFRGAQAVRVAAVYSCADPGRALARARVVVEPR